MHDAGPHVARVGVGVWGANEGSLHLQKQSTFPAVAREGQETSVHAQGAEGHAQYSPPFPFPPSPMGSLVDVVDVGPQAAAVAHGAGLGRGVEHVTLEHMRAQVLAGIANGNDLAVPANKGSRGVEVVGDGGWVWTGSGSGPGPWSGLLYHVSARNPCDSPNSRAGGTATQPQRLAEALTQWGRRPPARLRMIGGIGLISELLIEIHRFLGWFPGITRVHTPASEPGHPLPPTHG